uniref:Metalloendopeptidase n=1 Tax=Strongyloides papillosus TaxID=174720 RepID=A0A0N5CCJ8_STREA
MNFARKPNKFIRTKKRNRLNETAFGKAKELTFNDAKLVNFQYCLGTIKIGRKKCLHYDYPSGTRANKFHVLPYFIGKLCQLSRSNFAYYRKQNVFLASGVRKNAVLIAKKDYYYFIEASHGKKIRFDIEFLEYRSLNGLCNNFEHVEIRDKIDYSVSGKVICSQFLSYREINASINHREKRAVLQDPRYKWNTATFFYDIDPSLKDDTIILGLLMIKQRTCLKFKRVHKINGKSVHILYIPGAIYLTNLGYRGKLPHKIMVPKHDKDPARIARETLRALGFDYEHNRPDRDFYLYISFKYLHMDVKPLFYKKPPATVKTFDLNYDYRSVMHFAAHELCKKGRKCIKTRKRDWLVEETMGRATELTFNDAKLVNLQYCTSLIAVKRKKCHHYGYPPSILPNQCICLPYFSGSICQYPRKNPPYCRKQNVFIASGIKKDVVLTAKKDCYYFIEAHYGRKVRFEIKFLNYRPWKRLCNIREHVEIREKHDISVSGTLICPRRHSYKFISKSGIAIIHTKYLIKIYELKLSYRLL